MARISLLVLFVVVVSGRISAQDSKVAYELELKEVPVVAKRPLKSTGIQKTRLDTLVLHDNIALSMADILLQHSTIFVKSYGRATQATAEFRGTSASHTQVTWNGMKMNSPMLGTVDFSLVPSYFIDDASLYHGASSINITGGGLGGAVELATKPTDYRGLGVQYIQGVGSFETYDQFLRLSYGSDRWQSSTRVVYSSADNDYKYTNYDKKVDVYKEGVLVDSYHPEERNKSGYFKDFHLLQEFYYNSRGGHRFGVSAWYMSSERGLPFLSVDYKSDLDFTNEQGINTLRTVVSWDYLQDHFKWSAKGGYAYSDVAYDYTKRQAGFTMDITHSRSYVNTVYGQGEVEFMPSPKWLFNMTVAMHGNFVNSSDKSPFHIGDNYDRGRFEVSGNVSAHWKPFERFALAACLREETYGDKIVPLIPALFLDYVISKRWNIVAKASIARNYRYPSLDDLYFQPGGNPDLDPEYGFTYDGGIEFDVTGKKYSLGGNLTFFDSRIKDWILWTPDTKGFWRPSNVKKVHNYGIEFTTNNRFILPGKVVLGVDGNFAWTPSLNYGKRVNSNDASYGKQLCYIPLYSAAVSGNLKWKTWVFTYKWSYYSERYTTTSNDVSLVTGRLKPYFMSDVSLEKKFSCKWIDWSIKGLVNNLFNTEYVTVLSRPMPRQNYEVFLELRPRFGKAMNGKKKS